MSETKQAVDQKDVWNGAAGRAWVDSQEMLDGLFRPFEVALAKEVREARDAGCSTWGAGRGARR